MLWRVRRLAISARTCHLKYLLASLGTQALCMCSCCLWADGLMLSYLDILPRRLGHGDWSPAHLRAPRLRRAVSGKSCRVLKRMCTAC